MIELPPQSRITSRIDGEILTITLPPARARIGCIAGSWPAAAAFGFISVCCIAQGTFTGNLLWTAAGFFFFFIAGWQLLALRGGILRFPSATKLEIGPESVAIISGPAEAAHRKTWPRSAIAAIRVDAQPAVGPASLCLQLRDESDAIRLYSSDDREELDWIAAQISRRISGAAT